MESAGLGLDGQGRKSLRVSNTTKSSKETKPRRALSATRNTVELVRGVQGIKTLLRLTVPILFSLDLTKPLICGRDSVDELRWIEEPLINNVISMVPW